jgi:hypothetical protein
MPSLERLARLSDTADLRVVGIAVDGDANLAKEFVLRYGITFRNLIDIDGKVTRAALGIKALPETFFIGNDGRVIARFRGGREWSETEVNRVFSAQGNVPPALKQLRSGGLP